MDSTHIRWLEECLERNTVKKILKAEKRQIGKDKESMREKRNQRELLWFQTEGAFNFITAAPHCGEYDGYCFMTSGHACHTHVMMRLQFAILDLWSSIAIRLVPH
jgi:hypothetical protein